MAGFVTGTLLPLALVFIMFGMGLTLTIADFKRVIKIPKATAIGLVAQLILLPLFGLLIVSVFSLSPVLTVGLILLTLCPGGTTSNMISYLAKADVALSVTLTAISSMVTIITVPIFLKLSMQHFMGENEGIQIIKVVLPMIGIAILPVVLGMVIKAYAEPTAQKIEKLLAPFSIIFFVFIIAVAVYKDRANFFLHLQQVALPVIIINVVMMTLGFLLARSFKVNIHQSFTISLETGLQNGTLAITIANTVLNKPEMAVPGAVYGFLMFFTVVPVIMIARKTLIKPAS